MENLNVARTAIHEQIIEQIEKLIHNGTLKPGDKLPSERKLAEMLHVSRSTVRLAIQGMADNGMLETRRGSGTFIASGDNRTLTQVLAEAMGIGREKMEEVFAVRQIVEPEIAELAARKRTHGDIALLRETLEAQKLAIAAGDPGNEEDILFHDLLAKIAGNNILRSLLETLRDSIVDSRSIGLQSETRQHTSIKAHECILEAIEKGDAHGAGTCMRNHLDEIATILFTNNNNES